LFENVNDSNGGVCNKSEKKTAAKLFQPTGKNLLTRLPLYKIMNVVLKKQTRWFFRHQL